MSMSTLPNKYPIDLVISMVLPDIFKVKQGHKTTLYYALLIYIYLHFISSNYLRFYRTHEEYN